MEATLSTLLEKHRPKGNQIQANPWQVIPIKNSKGARQTTQIHLGGRSATILVNFKSFPNLQILWINDNQLVSLAGIENNFRIKHLFAQQNKIASLDNIFEKLKYVQTLVLYDNQLRDLQKIIKQLKPLKNLKTLQLFDNPVSHQPNYKLRLLYALPDIEILDRHKISHQEKQQAVIFMTQGKKTKKPFH